MSFPFDENSIQAPPNSPTPVRTVLFDYGMVLSGPPDPAAWSAIRSITGLGEAPLHTAYWAFRHEYDRGALTGTAYWHAVAAQTGIVLTDTQIAALFAADVDLWSVPNPPMIAWAAQLQRAGVRTGILSNIGDNIAQGIVARLPWLAAFDHCTWSALWHMAKPEPEIYIQTAAALHTPPVNILFLDDKQENIQAAAAVGMQTLHFTTYPALELEMRARGYAYLLEAASAPTEPAAAK